MEDQLRTLVAFALGLLLILLRLDAERFGAAEYDEARDGRPPSRLGRLAWYVLGFGIIALAMVAYPGSAGEIGLSLGSDRVAAISLGFILGAMGIAQAMAFAYLRYGRLRLPDPASYPGAIANGLATAFIDEAAFRGLFLGFLLMAGLEPRAAIVVQALVYTLATRTGAAGRPPYMFVLSLGIGFLGGWATVVTGGIGAAFLGHAITRISVFLATGHAGSVAPTGREVEDVLRRRLIPEGWRVIGPRDGRGSTAHER